MKEKEIREILSANLSSIFPELNLVEAEYYLPKTKGTRGYIDILAKHLKGNYVIIELKRSENSARQAIHELIKYAEGLKEKLSLKNSEIELYIISTEWNELILPFSSFKKTALNQIKGFKLFVDDSKKLSIQNIEPLKFVGDRLFSPYQTCRHYSSSETLEFGISEHEQINLERRLYNFAFVILKSPVINKEELANYISLMTNAALESASVESDGDTTQISAEKLPNSKFVIYQSYIRSSKDHYLELLKENPEYLKETLDHIQGEGYDEEDELNYLEEAALMNTGKYPKTEYAEYAYPAKFKKMIKEEGYEVVEIKLYGSLKENEVLNDEMILHEFEGQSGTEKVLFRGHAHSESKSQLKEALDKSQLCTDNNPIWSGHISHFFNLITKEKRIFNLSTTVFNPFNILISLFRCLKYQSNDFMPYYELSLQFQDEIEVDKLYYGIITWNGQRAPSLNKLIEDHFEGEEFNVVSPMIWGGDIDNNLNILNALGLKYSSVLVEHKNGQKINEFIFKDFEFKRINEDKLKTIYDFVETNIDLLINLTSLIEAHSTGLNNEMVFNVKEENGTPDNNVHDDHTP